MVQRVRDYRPDHFFSHFTVGIHQAGDRLDKFIIQFYPTLSREFIKKKIFRGEIFIKNRSFRTLPSTRIQKDDIVTMSVPQIKTPVEKYGNIEFKLDAVCPIVFEDKNVVAVNKPAHMLTHPSGRQLYHCVTIYVANELEHRVYNVHRLDKETSGLLLLTKNVEYTQKYTGFFQLGKVRKVYLLFAKKNSRYKGIPDFADEKIFDAPAEKRANGFIPVGFDHKVGLNSSKGRDAKTFFKSIMENDQYVVALAFPKTGRQHQIRLHAAYHGFPLVGDKLYLDDPEIFFRHKEGLSTEEDLTTLELYRHALHAYSLKIDKYNFIANIPNELLDWLKIQFTNFNIGEFDEKIQKEISSWDKKTQNIS